MKIYLAHINYTVKVKRYRKVPDGSPNAIAYVERIDKNTSVIHIPNKFGAGDLSHELIHVLQNICQDRDMEFTREVEHMGYLMHYLMSKIRGYTWA